MEILKVVEKQIYKLKLPAKWRIHSMFHILFLKRDITKNEAIDQKIADQFEFEKREQPEQEDDLIIDSMVFAKKAIDDKPLKFYYLIH